jgi:hypothetical protein
MVRERKRRSRPNFSEVQKEGGKRDLVLQIVESPFLDLEGGKRAPHCSSQWR